MRDTPLDRLLKALSASPDPLVRRWALKLAAKGVRAAAAKGGAAR